MSRPSIMQNPFLIIRFVFFALLANLNILITTFASWNVNTSVMASLPVSATAAVTLLSSCVILLCLTLALAGLLFPEAGSSKLLFECSWSGVLAVVQIGTAIGSTLHRPGATNWSFEASASLLVPISWLSSVVCMAYFMILFISTVAHSSDYPEIWYSTVYSVDWFGKPQAPDAEKAEQSSINLKSKSIDVASFNNKEDQNQENPSPPWAPKIRRGIDEPFKRSLRVPPSAHSSTTLIAVFPPGTIFSDNLASPGFSEEFRQSEPSSRPSSPVQHPNGQLNQTDSLPPRIQSHDLPIPLTQLCDWLPAEEIKGIDDNPRV